MRRPFQILGKLSRVELSREELELLSALATKHKTLRRFFHSTSNEAFGFHWLKSAQILEYCYIPLTVSPAQVEVCLNLLLLEIPRESRFLATRLRLLLQNISTALGTSEPGFHTESLQ